MIDEESKAEEDFSSKQVGGADYCLAVANSGTMFIFYFVIWHVCIYILLNLSPRTRYIRTKYITFCPSNSKRQPLLVDETVKIFCRSQNALTRDSF